MAKDVWMMEQHTTKPADAFNTNRRANQTNFIVLLAKGVWIMVFTKQYYKTSLQLNNEVSPWCGTTHHKTRRRLQHQQAYKQTSFILLVDKEVWMVEHTPQNPSAPLTLAGEQNDFIFLVAKGVWIIVFTKQY